MGGWKWVGKVWTEFIWFRMGTGGRLWVTHNELFGFHKMGDLNELSPEKLV
jgi:hypothetical protein